MYHEKTTTSDSQLPAYPGMAQREVGQNLVQVDERDDNVGHPGRVASATPGQASPSRSTKRVTVGSRADRRFVAKMRPLLEEVDASVAAWLVKDGARGFVVHQPEVFAETVLPKYWSHRNFGSFARLAGMWGFKRRTQGSSVVFAHDIFRRDAPEDDVKCKNKRNAAKAAAMGAAHTAAKAPKAARGPRSRAPRQSGPVQSVAPQLCLPARSAPAVAVAPPVPAALSAVSLHGPFNCTAHAAGGAGLPTVATPPAGDESDAWNVLVDIDAMFSALTDLDSGTSDAVFESILPSGLCRSISEQSAVEEYPTGAPFTLPLDIKHRPDPPLHPPFGRAPMGGDADCRPGVLPTKPLHWTSCHPGVDAEE